MDVVDELRANVRVKKWSSLKSQVHLRPQVEKKSGKKITNISVKESDGFRITKANEIRTI